MACMNHVHDFDSLQGLFNRREDVPKPLYDINHRIVSIENSGDETVAVLIHGPCGPPKTFHFILKPNEMRRLSLNPHEESEQFIEIFDPQTKKFLTAHPYILAKNATSFVLRSGVRTNYHNYGEPMWTVLPFNRRVI